MKWEYLTTPVGHWLQQPDYLALMGAQGWELAAVWSGQFFFKRPLVEPEETVDLGEGMPPDRTAAGQAAGQTDCRQSLKQQQAAPAPAPPFHLLRETLLGFAERLRREVCYQTAIDVATKIDAVAAVRDLPALEARFAALEARHKRACALLDRAYEVGMRHHPFWPQALLDDIFAFAKEDQARA